MTPSITASQPITLLLEFDAALYAGDLPVQAYGRRLAERLPADTGVGLIAAMRRLLEGRDVPGDPGTDLSGASDGRQAVELLAAAGGLDVAAIEAAYRASRRDVARSAFAMEAPTGLAEFLVSLPEATQVAVVSDVDDSGVTEVLEAGGLTTLVDEVLGDAARPDRRHAIVADAVTRSGGAERVICVGSRWTGLVADVAAAGGWTALVDRFDRYDPSRRPPDAVAPDLAGLLPMLRTRIFQLFDLEAP